MSDQNKENEIPEGLDCFGILYDTSLVECRKLCAVRFLCKEELAKKFRELGKDAVKKMEEEVTMANTKSREKPAPDEKVYNVDISPSVFPHVSPMVAEVSAMISNFGLKPVHRQGNYLVFKVGSATLLTITKVKARSPDGLVKFVHEETIEEFPEDFRQHLHYKSGRYFALRASSLAEIQTLLEKYLSQFMVQE